MLQIIILAGVLAIICLLLVDKVQNPLQKRAQRRIILDSCALIDGRITELVKTGFISAELIIPKFILRELQMLADGNDSHKRERARFGLETAQQLQELADTVSLDETDYSKSLATDDKLIVLAGEKKADLCTTDYNLNKVASVEGVRVLNVNELSQALRPIKLPGEQEMVKIIQKGSGAGQGVGYLDDGTMIVVENGAKLIGSSVRVEIDHMLQTVAGKMAFAKTLPAKTQASPSNIRSQAAHNRSATGRSTKQQPLARRLRKSVPTPHTSQQLEQSLLRRVNR